MRDYLMGIIASAGMIAVVSSLTSSKSAAGGLIRMIGGIYLMFVVIQPLARFDFDSLNAYVRKEIVLSEQEAASGREQGREVMERIIKAECETYIRDKALEHGIILQADVTLTEDETPMPESVILYGSVMMHEKREVEQIIESDLNIPKENQKWTGSE